MGSLASRWRTDEVKPHINKHIHSNLTGCTPTPETPDRCSSTPQGRTPHLSRVRWRSSALPHAAARRCASAVPPSLTAAFSTTWGIWSCTTHNGGQASGQGSMRGS